MDRFVVEGYGPPDLITHLYQASWEQCMPSGKNFRGIEFGNRVLADTPDPYCPLKHHATIAPIPSGKSFHVEGYNFENLCEGMRNGSLILILAGHRLCDPPLHQIGNLIPYRVIIELM